MKMSGKEKRSGVYEEMKQRWATGRNISEWIGKRRRPRGSCDGSMAEKTQQVEVVVNKTLQKKAMLL